VTVNRYGVRNLQGHLIALAFKSKTRTHVKTVWRPGTVAHACNPTYLGGRDWEGWQLEASLGKKFTRSHSNQWLGMVTCTCHPQLRGEAQIGGYRPACQA
jgi:hypothetical protein